MMQLSDRVPEMRLQMFKRLVQTHLKTLGITRKAVELVKSLEKMLQRPEEGQAVRQSTTPGPRSGEVGLRVLGMMIEDVTLFHITSKVNLFELGMEEE